MTWLVKMNLIKDYDMTDTLTNHTCVVAQTLIHPLKPQKAYIPPEK